MFQRLILLFIFLGSVVFAYSSEKALSQGDSLFATQKYTEAFTIYEGLFAEGKFSSAMLLRMAFIKDGLGDYPEALYYLDLYYKKSADKSVVTKINEISEEQGLAGYAYNDSHFFRALLIKYKWQIQLVLLALTVFLTAYIYRKKKNNERPITASIFQLVIMIGLLAVSNNVMRTDEGIIREDNTLLRSGPSAGAEPVTFVSKGHKVQILEQTPVWTRINWDGEEVFIRKNRIKVI